MMTDKQKGNILIVIALIGFIGLIWAISEIILDKYYLSKDYRYSITKKISYGTPSKTGAQFKYYFEIKSEAYAGFTSSSLNEDSVYFVKFYPMDPNRNEVTLVVANENDIKNLPPDGYKELPHK
jgi:hypothetical protein